jgi:hypothetical protein
MMTVCPGIAEQYHQEMGMQPVVVTNAPNYAPLEPRLRPEHDARIRMIHHGAALPPRKIEHMITLMNYLDERFELDFLLVVPEHTRDYFQYLQEQARGNPRIRFLPVVPMQELVAVSHQYDIGLFLLQPTSFSYLHALPNKFFEFIQARLAVAIGPSPEMARIVQDHDLGVVSDDFSPQSLAQRLMHLDHAQINYYKQQSHKAARIFSAEQNTAIVQDLVEKVLMMRQ